MAGVFSSEEYKLFERVTVALERIAASVNVRLGGNIYPETDILSRLPPTYHSKPVICKSRAKRKVSL